MKLRRASDSPLPGEKFLGPDFFEALPVDCARALVGCRLVWGGCVGKIVETEAYSEKSDPACHTFLRGGARRFVEQHQPGTAYVYLNYGVHWLFNVLVKHQRERGFVLVRAVEPLRGLPWMRRRRGKGLPLRALCSGPGKLTRAFGIKGCHHGFNLCHQPRHALYPRETEPDILSDIRIGISRARELPWRFLIPENPHLSVPPTK